MAPQNDKFGETITSLKMVEINTPIKQWMHQMYLAARENESLVVKIRI